MITRSAGIVLIAACVTACQKDLPAGPSPENEQAFGIAGVIVYEDATYGGESAVITRDISDLPDFKGPCSSYSAATQTVVSSWNDCISSVRVAPGWRATLYRDDGYRDDSLEVDADVPDLRRIPHDCPKGGLNDCLTSVRVRGPS
jgi:hypothetical protein